MLLIDERLPGHDLEIGPENRLDRLDQLGRRRAAGCADDDRVDLSLGVEDPLRRRQVEEVEERTRRALTELDDRRELELLGLLGRERHPNHLADLEASRLDLSTVQCHLLPDGRGPIDQCEARDGARTTPGSGEDRAALGLVERTVDGERVRLEGSEEPTLAEPDGRKCIDVGDHRVVESDLDLL